MALVVSSSSRAGWDQVTLIPFNYAKIIAQREGGNSLLLVGHHQVRRIRGFIWKRTLTLFVLDIVPWSVGVIVVKAQGTRVVPGTL